MAALCSIGARAQTGCEFSHKKVRDVLRALRRVPDLSTSIDVPYHSITPTVTAAPRQHERTWFVSSFSRPDYPEERIVSPLPMSLLNFAALDFFNNLHTWTPCSEVNKNILFCKSVLVAVFVCLLRASCGDWRAESRLAARMQVRLVDTSRADSQVS